MLVMEDTARELVVATVQQHAESLLRVARRYTDCPADAEDAYQRALEILVKSAHRLDPETVHKWLHTVLKHEAFAVREQRSRLVGVPDEDALDALDDARHVASVEERSERFDELTRAAEALQRCKPQEVTALVLKAQGLSYAEIAEREGWTYTKVNRSLTEGRRAFLSRFAAIETGEECERWAPVLSAMADGEANARDVLAVRPHLRNCAACRATLADMRRAPAAAAALLPAGLVGAPASGGLVDRLAELAFAVQERVVAPLLKAQTALETAGVTKIAAVAASTVAIAGGGVAAQGSSAGEPVRTAAPAIEKPVAAPPTSNRTTPLAQTTPDAPTPAPDPKRPEPAGAEFAVGAAEGEARAPGPRERPNVPTARESSTAPTSESSATAADEPSTAPTDSSAPSETAASRGARSSGRTPGSRSRAAAGAAGGEFGFVPPR